MRRASVMVVVVTSVTFDVVTTADTVDMSTASSAVTRRSVSLSTCSRNTITCVPSLNHHSLALH